MSFLCEVAGLSLIDRVRSSDIQREQLLCIKRSELRCFGYLITMLPGCLPFEDFWARKTDRRPWGRPRTRQRDYIPNPAWGTSGLPCLTCCHHELTPGKWWKMDVWMEFAAASTTSYLNLHLKPFAITVNKYYILYKQTLWLHYQYPCCLPNSKVEEKWEKEMQQSHFAAKCFNAFQMLLLLFPVCLINCLLHSPSFSVFPPHCFI